MAENDGEMKTMMKMPTIMITRIILSLPALSLSRSLSLLKYPGSLAGIMPYLSCIGSLNRFSIIALPDPLSLLQLSLEFLRTRRYHPKISLTCLALSLSFSFSLSQ